MSDASNKIRKFRVRDLDTIVEIEKVSFKDPYSRSTFYFFYREYPDTFWVYEEEKVIGYIMFIPEGHVINIAVAPSHKHRGIGTELMKFAIDAIVSKRVWLEVRESNIDAQKFYQKLGFKKEKVIRRYYGQEDAYILVLEKRDTAL